MTDIDELIKRLQESALNWLNEVESRTQAAEAIETLRSQLNDMMTEHGNRLDECARLRVELEEARKKIAGLESYQQSLLQRLSIHDPYDDSSGRASHNMR